MWDFDRINSLQIICSKQYFMFVSGRTAWLYATTLNPTKREGGRRNPPVPIKEPTKVGAARMI